MCTWIRYFNCKVLLRSMKYSGWSQAQESQTPKTVLMQDGISRQSRAERGTVLWRWGLLCRELLIRCTWEGREAGIDTAPLLVLGEQNVLLPPSKWWKNLKQECGEAQGWSPSAKQSASEQWKVTVSDSLVSCSAWSCQHSHNPAKDHRLSVGLQSRAHWAFKRPLLEFLLLSLCLLRPAFFPPLASWWLN